MRVTHPFRAFGYGVLAYAVGFGATLAVLWLEVDGADWSDAVVDELLPVTAWVYHGAHFVGVSGPAPTLFRQGHNVAREPELGLPLAVVFIIPVLVLVGAGFLYSRWCMRDHYDKTYGRRFGAEIAVGYAVAAFLAAYWSVDTVPYLIFDVQVGPDLGMTVLMMGVLYPVIFGAIGGWLYQGMANLGWIE